MLESSIEVDSSGLVLAGDARYRSGQTLLTDGARAVNLLSMTVMAQVAANLKWVPLDDVSPAENTLGSSSPSGVFWAGDVPFADLVAGDVPNQKILVGSNVILDESKVVLEGALTLDTIVVNTGLTIRAMLSAQGIDFKPTSYFQNIPPIA